MDLQDILIVHVYLDTQALVVKVYINYLFLMSQLSKLVKYLALQ